jgi:hypothetical protein
MKKISIGLLLAVCLFLFLSCQKEISTDNNAGNNGGGNGGGGGNVTDSFYLSEIVDIDSLTRDSIVLHFYYDNLKRVNLVTSWEQGFPVDSLYSFYYAGNATLPFKTIHHPYKDEWFHTYNTQNKLIADSLSDLADTGHIIYNTRNYKTEEFTYGADKIFIKTTHHWYEPVSQTNQVITTTDTSLIDVSGNTLFTRWNYFNETATQTYNSKPNPIAKLNIFRALHPYGFYEADETFIQSPNLWITGYQSATYPASVSTNDIKQINITYNARNYPVHSVISLIQSGGPVFYSSRYYYYKLL